MLICSLTCFLQVFKIAGFATMSSGGPIRARHLFVPWNEWWNLKKKNLINLLTFKKLFLMLISINRIKLINNNQCEAYLLNWDAPSILRQLEGVIWWVKPVQLKSKCCPTTVRPSFQNKTSKQVNFIDYCIQLRHFGWKFCANFILKRGLRVCPTLSGFS